VFTDPAIVLSMFMLSFIFGIGFRGLRWKWICVVFCSFYFSVTAGVRIADIGGITIKRTGTASTSRAVVCCKSLFVLLFFFFCSLYCLSCDLRLLFHIWYLETGPI
jgi:hypothetical protein